MQVPLWTNSNSESYRGGNSGKCSIQVHQVDKRTIQLGWLELQEGDGISTLGIKSGDGRKIKAEETANPQPAEKKKKKRKEKYNQEKWSICKENH